jgi:hypothetical protein
MLYSQFADVATLILGHLHKWIRAQGHHYYVDEQGRLRNEKGEVGLLLGMYDPWATRDRENTLAHNVHFLAAKLHGQVFDRKECAKLLRFVTHSSKNQPGVPSNELHIQWISPDQPYKIVFFGDYPHARERVLLLREK